MKRLRRWLKKLVGIKPREPLVSLIIPKHDIEWWADEIAAGRMEYDPETEVMTLLEASDNPPNAIDDRHRATRDDEREESLRKTREMEIRLKHPKLPSNFK